MKKNFLIMLFIFTVAACMERDHTPEGALKDFIEARIGKVVTREFVLERVTGKMKQSFENMSDDDFAKFSDLRNVKRNSFKVLSKSCQESKCFLTYLIGFNTNDQFHSEVKKIAEMSHIDGKWYIEDISNIKTYHESLEAINPLE
ncbi:MAG TPA: hypothetical protein VKY27_11730 [Bacteriovoracaceae bacterium]|nr:hypothetical protein [Bacteriovoracaceae bacterium]